jgi:poly-gamma-glutamate capsule biosynthesis protein CapA/YwtB (metallophosphatase superfamily)
MLLGLTLSLLAAAPDAGVLLRLRAAGDVMLGTPIPEGNLPPDDGAHLLDAVAPLLRDADLTFVNLEGPLCDTGVSHKCRPGSPCYAFRTPTHYAAYLEDAGIDLASTANNHAGDYGEACRRETEATLEAHHIAWSGPPGTVARVTANGLKVALVAFHPSSSTNDLTDIPAAAALVAREAREADLVVVSFHGGAEGLDASHVKPGVELYLGENRGDLRAFAHAVVDAGAAVVLGHGPHVLRGLELYRGHLIAYSLGNFATYGRFNLSGALAVAGVLEVSLGPGGRLLGGRLLPTRQEGRGVPRPDETGRGIALVKALSLEDFGPAAVPISDDGQLVP